MSIGFFFCRSIRFFLQRAASIPFGFKKDQEHRPALEILPRSAAFDASFQDGVQELRAKTCAPQ